MLAQATSFGDDGREGVPLDGFAEEHDRLEVLLEAAREALAPGREARAGECLARLAAAVDRLDEDRRDAGMRLLADLTATLGGRAS